MNQNVLNIELFIRPGLYGVFYMCRLLLLYSAHVKYGV